MGQLVPQTWEAPSRCLHQIPTLIVWSNVDWFVLVERHDFKLLIDHGLDEFHRLALPRTAFRCSIPAAEALVSDETSVHHIAQQASKHRLLVLRTLIPLGQSIGKPRPETKLECE